MNKSILLCDLIIRGLVEGEYSTIKEQLTSLKKLMLEEEKAVEDELIFLDCLHGCGVDNWEGYSDAQDMYREANENKNS